MKKLTILAGVLWLLVSLVACVSSPLVLDSRYEFDQFQEVDRISSYRLMNWQVVDAQSLIVQTSPGSYYLLILKRPFMGLRFTHAISFTRTGGSIYAKFDCVKIADNQCRVGQEQAAIHRIYRLDGKDSIAVVQAQIEGLTDEPEPPG